ncbi:MAG TPA: glycosyltransferase family 4 protein [Acidimicrobiales bacterium]|jgi:glycosyltransferase involved in cell wall biosynthesis|nr:glycosyltransferase family 4 protein [Acidimicrobiales bacterium]
MLAVSLLTLGSPDQLTGGYLYHCRMAELASQHDAHLDLVSVPALPFPLPAAAAGRALRRAAAADVLVVDSIAAAFVAPWRPSRPLAAMLHQPPGGIDHGPPRRWLQAALDRALYRRCDLLMLASQTLLPQMSGFRTVVVAPGRDVAAPPSGPPVDLRRGRRVALLSVGNWVDRKGTLDLLDAFGRLEPGLATLHLVGRTDIDRKYTSRVRARLARSDLAGRVVVHGPVTRDEVAVLYRSADVFVLPSYREPYGTAYGEAMAAGLPVVGWRAGNLPNLAGDDREGVVLEPGDVAGLAAALERLANDARYRQRLAAAARQRARQLPTWHDTARRFFGLLRGLADAAPR